MVTTHHLAGVLVPLLVTVLASVAVVAIPADQTPEDPPGSSGGGIEYVTSSAVRARDDAAEAAKVAKQEQDEAVRIRAALKKELDAARESGLSGPKVSTEELNQRRERYENATRVVTEKTLAATEARKELNRRERDVQSLTPPPGTSASAVPAVNPLTSLNPHLGPTYVHVAELNQILADARRLPPPMFGDPRYAAEPIEVQLRKIQHKFEPDPASRAPEVAKFPRKPPDIVNAGPVSVAGTRWSVYQFDPGGNLKVGEGGWPLWGAATWSQNGDTIVMHWKAKSPYHGTYFFPEHWVEYTVHAQISGDTMTGTKTQTFHTTHRGRAPETKSDTQRFTAKRQD